MHDMAGATLNITDAGRAALINGDHTGTAARKVVLVGVANAPFDFNPGMQAMPNELKRIGTISGENIAPDTVHVTIRDDGPDQFKLYGFGLYLDNGVLLGTYCQATPIMEKSPVSILLVAVDVVFKTLDVTALAFGNANFTNPPATTERQGVVELATNQETIDGTDAQRAVTPAGLTARTSTESRTGLVQLATDAEVLAGKDDGKAVTSKKLAVQLAKKAEVAGTKTQVFSVASATAVEHAVPLGQADERFATPASVKAAQDTANAAKATADAALPKSGGDMTGPINLKGPAVELQFTDTSEPVTFGRFRMVSSGRNFVLDRNSAAAGDFSSFVRVLQIDTNGNAAMPGTIKGAALRTQTNVNLPTYNSDGKGFVEFGGDTVIWRMFAIGASGNFVLNGYNVDGSNRHQPFMIEYTTGRFVLPVRPLFDGATPYDTKNLVNPLTAEGGVLSANKGFTFGVGYGRSALVVSSNGTDSIGGAFADWNGTRTPALQVDTPSNVGAYMGIRWTQWGQRHLAAIDCYAGGSNASVPYIAMHVGGKAVAFTFDANGDLGVNRNITLGQDINTSVGAKFSQNGNIYMQWAGMWLSDYLGSRATKGGTCQTAGLTEFGAINISAGGNQTYDLPAPYVMCGLRNIGNTTIIYLRGCYLYPV